MSAPDRELSRGTGRYGVRPDGTEDRAPDTGGSAFTCPVNKRVQNPVHGGDVGLHPRNMTADGNAGVSELPHSLGKLHLDLTFLQEKTSHKHGTGRDYAK